MAAATAFGAASPAAIKQLFEQAHSLTDPNYPQNEIIIIKDRTSWISAHGGYLTELVVLTTSITALKSFWYCYKYESRGIFNVFSVQSTSGPESHLTTTHRTINPRFPGVDPEPSPSSNSDDDDEG
ncbi:uncharacterized protein J7T54_000562 [Emericellopsis cladophorae]|uniref:Uncharacterized protein n=1 Tax=Emericellopsis cladophorae TaxID=2686198 RepID=A0A9Q0B991_9HYPO|nr:uncharacterized protein J7T54_000562 [Emericellopsis cladophorae]KAI6777757.1 hypothetical protein J7T54_000562 [Emericellopsis cladophorae]